MTSASPLPPYASRSDKQFPSRSGKQAASSVSSRSAAQPDTAVPRAPDAQDQPEASPAAPVLSTAAAAAAAPVAAARRVLAAKGGLPLYAGLGGLALAGIIDWPVALAAGTGYGLARFWASLDQQQQPVPGAPRRLARTAAGQRTGEPGYPQPVACRSIFRCIFTGQLSLITSVHTEAS